jgi:hypothetical protein
VTEREIDKAIADLINTSIDMDVSVADARTSDDNDERRTALKKAAKAARWFAVQCDNLSTRLPR